MRRRFESSHFRLDLPEGIVAQVVGRDSTSAAYVHSVVVGAPTVDGPSWLQAPCGLNLNAIGLTASRATAREVIEAGDLRPAGGPEGLVSRPFAGHAALWRLPRTEGEWYWAYTVAHGILWSAHWATSPEDPKQAALLAGIELLRPTVPPLPFEANNSGGVA